MKKTYVTSGMLKGREVAVPVGIRPTQEKVRKALFDMLRQVIVGSTFLELYAGSGAVGMEALSNGAKEVVFVENDFRCQKMIERNIMAMEANGEMPVTSILAMDVQAAISLLRKNGKKFDVVFLDPPYYRDLAKNTLQRLSSCDILTPHCVIVAERNKRDSLDRVVFNLTCFKQKRYGDTVLSFYEIA